MTVAGYDLTFTRKSFDPNAESRHLSTDERLELAHKAAVEAAQALLRPHSH